MTGLTDSQPDRMPGPSGESPRLERMARFLTLVLVVSALAAMILQDLSGALPMGVQNQGRGTWIYLKSIFQGPQDC